MKPCKVCRNSRTETSRLCLLPRRAISLNYETKGSELRSDVLSHLLTMTFIARQLGFKVSLKVSGKEY